MVETISHLCLCFITLYNREQPCFKLSQQEDPFVWKIQISKKE